MSDKFHHYIRFIKSGGKGGNVRHTWLQMNDFEQDQFESYEYFKEYLLGGEAEQDMKSYIYDLVRYYKISYADDVPNIPNHNEIMLMSKSYYGIHYNEFDLVYDEIFGE
ncbi:MAG: hypothetical protein ACOCZ5_01535 [bacterium]